MAQNKTISQLSAATYANNSDLLPIVQSGITKKITKENFIPRYYGVWYDTETQVNYSPNDSLPVSANTLDFAYGITQSGGTITFDYDGIYNIQFSLQISKTDAGTDKISIWLVKGVSVVDWTNTDITLQGSDALQVAAWNFIVDAKSGDEYSIRWSSADSEAIIKSVPAQVSPQRPAIPSVILTITQVA